MTKPLFASKWYKDVPANELRQEIQNLYRELASLKGETAEDLESLEEGKVDRAGDTVLGDLDILGNLFEGGDRVAEYGSNENGEYVRFSNGFQVCWVHDLVLSYDSSRALRNTWTYPAPFSSTPMMVPAILSATGGDYSGINLNTIGNPFFVASKGTTSVQVYIWNNNATYTAGNSATVRLAAFGRWK